MNQDRCVVVGDHEYITTQKIADDLGVVLSTIHRWVRHYEMPHYRVGQMLLFDAGAVNAWIQAHQPKRGRPRKRTN
jgi:excisionase family DNA binding protein